MKKLATLVMTVLLFIPVLGAAQTRIGDWLVGPIIKPSEEPTLSVGVLDNGNIILAGQEPYLVYPTGQFDKISVNNSGGRTWVTTVTEDGKLGAGTWVFRINETRLNIIYDANDKLITSLKKLPNGGWLAAIEDNLVENGNVILNGAPLPEPVPNGFLRPQPYVPATQALMDKPISVFNMALTQTDSGTVVFLAVLDGLVKGNLATGRFSRVSYFDGYDVRDVAVDGDTLYVSRKGERRRNGGLIKALLTSDGVVVVDSILATTEPSMQGLSDPSAVKKIHNGWIFIGTRSAGIYIVNQNFQLVGKLPALPLAIVFDIAQRQMPDNSYSSIWIGTDRGALAYRHYPTQGDFPALPPAAPENVTASADYGQRADVSWTWNGPDSVFVRYEVRLNGELYSEISDVHQTSAVVYGLNAGARNEITVAVVDKNGAKSEEPSIFATTLPMFGQPDSVVVWLEADGAFHKALFKIGEGASPIISGEKVRLVKSFFAYVDTSFGQVTPGSKLKVEIVEDLGSHSEMEIDMQDLKQRGLIGPLGEFEVLLPEAVELSSGFAAISPIDQYSPRIGYNSESEPIMRVGYEEKAVQVPSKFALHQNYPNPFNAQTTIPFDLPEDSPVVLEIYNLRGQVVRTLKHEQSTAGPYAELWDGTNDAGQAVTSGIYIYRLEVSGRFEKSKKMILLK